MFKHAIRHHYRRHTDDVDDSGPSTPPSKGVAPVRRWNSFHHGRSAAERRDSLINLTADLAVPRVLELRSGRLHPPRPPPRRRFSAW